MSDLVTFLCPSCGAQLKAGDTRSKIKCEYCGTEHSQREAVAGVDRLAAEMAIPRLTQEISQLETRLTSANSKAIQARYIPWPPGLQSVLLILGIMTAGLLVSQLPLVAIVPGAIFGLIIYLRGRSNLKHKEQRNPEAEAISQQIKEKQAVLTRNRLIVDA